MKDTIDTVFDALIILLLLMHLTTTLYAYSRGEYPGCIPNKLVTEEIVDME